MTPFVIGIAGIILLFILLFSGMHIGLAMGISGFVGLSYLRGINAGLWHITATPYNTFSQNYGLTVLPLFVLMGILCYNAGITQELYDTAYTWLGGLRGGLAMASIGACSLFAAVSGSSAATSATMGTVALPEMKKYGYDDALATGCVAAGGSIGILIPPSIILVVYGLMTGQSIGKLFAAGIIPGILVTLLYILTVVIICKINPKLGPPGPKTSLRAKVASLANVWPVVVIFSVVMGGLFFGVFTPTEAGGIGAFSSFCFVVAKKKLNIKSFNASLIETGTTVAFIFLILMGAQLFFYFITATRLPSELASILARSELNPYLLMAGIMLMYLLLGCVMEGLSMIMITVPLILPIITGMGFHPIWFGIIIVRVIEMGLITPPVGINVFIIRGIAKDVPMITIFKGIIPFLIADAVSVALLIAFPKIVMFLPGKLF